jgi:hypothetical protein
MPRLTLFIAKALLVSKLLPPVFFTISLSKNGVKAFPFISFSRAYLMAP